MGKTPQSPSTPALLSSLHGKWGGVFRVSCRSYHGLQSMFKQPIVTQQQRMTLESFRPKATEPLFQMLVSPISLTGLD